MSQTSSERCPLAPINVNCLPATSHPGQNNHASSTTGKTQLHAVEKPSSGTKVPINRETAAPGSKMPGYFKDLDCPPPKPGPFTVMDLKWKNIVIVPQKGSTFLVAAIPIGRFDGFVTGEGLRGNCKIYAHSHAARTNGIPFNFVGNCVDAGLKRCGLSTIGGVPCPPLITCQMPVIAVIVGAVLLGLLFGIRVRDRSLLGIGGVGVRSAIRDPC